MSIEEQVILVDDNDTEIGAMPKMEAHRLGVLHRAFSVFVFNSKGEMLLQRRASGKYHSAGLWSNTCCSHPRPGELVGDAAVRRLKEEMGMVCKVKEIFSFIYNARLSNDLIEHEYDHVFMGTSDTLPFPNGQEVCEWVYLSPEVVVGEIERYPENYTAWFKLCIRDWYSELFVKQH